MSHKKKNYEGATEHQQGKLFHGVYSKPDGHHGPDKILQESDVQKYWDVEGVSGPASSVILKAALAASAEPVLAPQAFSVFSRSALAASSESPIPGKPLWRSDAVAAAFGAAAPELSLLKTVQPAAGNPGDTALPEWLRQGLRQAAIRQSLEKLIQAYPDAASIAIDRARLYIDAKGEQSPAFEKAGGLIRELAHPTTPQADKAKAVGDAAANLTQVRGGEHVALAATGDMSSPQRPVAPPPPVAASRMV